MNKLMSIFVGVLFSTLLLTSCGGSKDDASGEASGEGAAKTEKNDAAAKTENNDGASTGADEKAADEKAAGAEGTKAE
jgi:hypothetical protein